MSEYIRSLLLLSDIHAGSPYAVCDNHPIYVEVGNETMEIRPNKGQLELYKHWQYMEKMATKFNVDTVVNLADSVDGTNYYEGGRRLMTPDLEVQKDLAVRLLKPLVRGRKYVSVSGTKYHESLDSKVHREISQRLEGAAKMCLFLGVTGIVTLPEINKKMSLAHQASSAMLYTATMADRELIYWNVAEARDQLPHIDWMIRGHLHKFYHLDNGREHFLQLPCWKTYYPIKNSTRMIGRYQTDIGFSILQFDEAGRSTLKNFVYQAPNIAIKEGTL